MADRGHVCDHPSIMQPTDPINKDAQISDGSLALVTPLPRRELTLIWIIHCSQGFQTTMLFPMLVFMVEAYGVAGEQGHDLGYYAGLLASLFPLAQFCSSMVWGIISDRTGRRVWVAFGNAVSALSSLLLGLSRTYRCACMVRFLGGLLNGSMTITKSTMAELCDGTNQAKGYGILNLAWGIGAIGGPIVSGVLAQPCIQYASPNCPQFLQTHPFFLPCVSATLFSSIGVIAAIHLKETNKRVRNKNTTYKKIPPQKLVVNPGDTSIQRQKPADGETQFREMRHFKSSRYDEHMMDINLDECSSNNTTEQKLIVLISPIEESRKEEFGKSAAAVPLSTLPAEPVEEEAPQPPQPQNKPSSSTLDLLRDRDVLLSSFCYSMTGLVFIITDELFPLFGASSQVEGGLGFSSSKLGIVLGEAGLALCLYTLILYPVVAKRWGPLFCFRYGILGSILCWILFPTCSVLSETPTLQWILLMFTMAVRSAVACTAFTGVLILVTNSASSDNVGAVTGLSHSFCSFFRAIGPAIGGVIWSFSSTKNFPFHEFLAWQFVVLLSLCTFGLSYTLPKTLVRPKVNR
ncbi:hypothetical protein MPTK1_1g13390 [Marchantia polymorpha subsp. ruderalis]|uniref:Major facilitator superfamily (MFS) profile domain-containing protein n=2 Tax=Marchantia polymorpha TaxID=3197 RepID=A0AAF6APQ2_MARPO|nr:hypothetical protein MARPO_0019s0109 [Marchantia polymorpha]BBM98422.1 hypothetical protein Mp_1g13390 [Marchantia polymorpha subsp. ruderalis]|eukprot:PTQ44692.1 hypothetical protein MARPO_0019s0109 [Marchantia polymorpha]